MTQARRARVRPSRLVVPLVAAAVLLGGGTFAAIKYGNSGTTAGPQVTPTVAATESTAAPTSAEPTSTPTKATPSTKATSAAPVDTAARKALTNCQARVRAADDVMAAAKVGNAHWATHVQAQTDANQTRITITEMSGLFKKTRLAGPGDQRRYSDALSDYNDLKGSCSAVKGASKTTAAKLAKCEDRAVAQKPVLTAGAAGMKDWKAHLSAMQRNKEGHVYDPEDVWIRAWRAAPPHINAYKKAAKNFKAPSC